MREKSVNIAALKASLSAFLKQVKAGGSVIVTEHRNPIARIIPIEWNSAKPQCIEPSTSSAESFAALKPVKGMKKKNSEEVLALLLEERYK